MHGKAITGNNIPIIIFLGMKNQSAYHTLSICNFIQT